MKFAPHRVLTEQSGRPVTSFCPDGHPPCTRLSRSLTQPNPHHHSLLWQAPRAGVLPPRPAQRRAGKPSAQACRRSCPRGSVRRRVVEERCAGRSGCTGGGQSRACRRGSSCAAGRRPSACTSHLAEMAAICPSPAPQGTEGHDSSDTAEQQIRGGKAGWRSGRPAGGGAGWSRRRPPCPVRVPAQEPSATSALVSSAQPRCFAF
jgi:hypothetical protein